MRDDRQPARAHDGIGSWISNDPVYREAAYRLAVVAPAACASALCHGMKHQPPGGKRAVIRRLCEMMAEHEPPSWVEELADDIAGLARLAKQGRC